jgi:hypothetical protein
MVNSSTCGGFRLKVAVTDPPRIDVVAIPDPLVQCPASPEQFKVISDALALLFMN